MSDVGDRSVHRFADIRRRLAEAAQRVGVRSDDETRELLAQRARLLARKAAVEVSGPRHELLCFTLGSERYAIEARFVLRVIKHGHVTKLPHAPAHCLGICNLRGELLPVFDLRALLAVEATAPGESARVLVLGAERAELGLFVDAVEQIATLEGQAIFDAVHAPKGAAGEWMTGVTRDALSVLDGALLLSDSRLFLQGDADGGPQERSLA